MALSEEFQSYVREQAARYGIPESLAFSLITQESGGRQSAVSEKGATGIMQLMPGTAEELGVDMTDPYQNVEGGMRYLAQQYDTFGSWPLALAAYNAGPGAVSKYGGIPPYEETQKYVPAILKRAGMSDARISTSGSTASEELASGVSYDMFGDEYATPEERAAAELDMLKQSKKANRDVAGGSTMDYLSDALKYLDLSQLAGGVKPPSSVGPGIYRPRGGGGSRALQRFGIASLA